MAMSLRPKKSRKLLRERAEPANVAENGWFGSIAVQTLAAASGKHTTAAEQRL